MFAAHTGDINKMIRGNQGLEKDLDQMDIKIGLLVSNQIDVHEVLAHDKSLLKKISLRKATNASSSNGSRSRHGDSAATLKREGSSATVCGLKALKKESREKLDAYQHLFYLLQTNPDYLAKLIFVMPQSTTTRYSIRKFSRRVKSTWVGRSNAKLCFSSPGSWSQSS